jgi:GxxExxY protein
MTINELSESVIGACIEVHRAIGPGLLESAYQQCLCHELTLRTIRFASQVELPVQYKEVLLDCGYRLDFLIDNRLVIEIKAVDKLVPIHDAQLLTYLRLGGWQLGLLINFNEHLLKHGIKRIANDLDAASVLSASSAPPR